MELRVRVRRIRLNKRHNYAVVRKLQLHRSHLLARVQNEVNLSRHLDDLYEALRHLLHEDLLVGRVAVALNDLVDDRTRQVSRHRLTVTVRLTDVQVWAVAVRLTLVAVQVLSVRANAADALVDRTRIAITALAVLVTRTIAVLEELEHVRNKLRLSRPGRLQTREQRRRAVAASASRVVERYRQPAAVLIASQRRASTRTRDRAHKVHVVVVRRRVRVRPRAAVVHALTRERTEDAAIGLNHRKLALRLKLRLGVVTKRLRALQVEVATVIDEVDSLLDDRVRQLRSRRTTTGRHEQTKNLRPVVHLIEVLNLLERRVVRRQR